MEFRPVVSPEEHAAEEKWTPEFLSRDLGQPYYLVWLGPLCFVLGLFNCVTVDGELEKCGQGGFVVRQLRMCEGALKSVWGTVRSCWDFPANLCAALAERSDARGSTILLGPFRQLLCAMCCSLYAERDKEKRKRLFCLLLKVNLESIYLMDNKPHWLTTILLILL